MVQNLFTDIQNTLSNIHQTITFITDVYQNLYCEGDVETTDLDWLSLILNPKIHLSLEQTSTLRKPKQ